MRVRIQRTCTVPSDGRGGLPKKGVRSRMTLTVGAGYDLPEDTAKDLIARGLASRVEAYEKPDPEALRDGRRARGELQRVTRENGDLRSQIAERDDELAASREEIVRLRAELEAQDDDAGVDIGELTVTEAAERIAALATLEELAAVEHAEGEGKNRKGVIEAVEARRQELVAGGVKSAESTDAGDGAGAEGDGGK